MPQLLKLFFSSCLLTSGFAHRAMAGGSMEHFFSDEELLFHYGAVAVAEVIAIVDPDADTNKNPPKLAIQITEVIRGDIRPAQYKALWRPFPHDVDWGGKGAREALERWGRCLNPPPALHSKWIVAGDLSSTGFHIAPRCRYEFDEARLAWVKRTVIEGTAAKEE